METFKLKWTRLQNEIFRFLCINAGTKLNQNEISRALNVSPTAVAKSLKDLEDEEIIVKTKSSTMNLISIEINLDSEKVVGMKRAENLKMLYELGLVELLYDKFMGSLIILFGSYSYGTDISNSDIDIAIIGSKKKDIELAKFEKNLGRKIILQFYDSLTELHKNLRNNIINGIVLKGVIEI